MNWFGFLPAVIAVSLVPGASQLLGMRHAAQYGPAVALCGIGGRLAAFAVMIGLVAGGLGLVLLESPALFAAVTWVGVAYLAWLGVTALRSALRPDRPTDAAVTGAAPGSGVRRRVTLREFVVAGSNPKALLLFAALLPQFVSAGDATGRDLVLLGFAYLGIEAVVGLVYVLSGALLPGTGAPELRWRRIDIATGCGFLALAGALAVNAL